MKFHACLVLLFFVAIAVLLSGCSGDVDLDQYKKCVLNRSMVVMSVEEIEPFWLQEKTTEREILEEATNNKTDPWMVVFVIDDGTLKPGTNFVEWAKRQQGYVQKPPIEDPLQMVK